jgi:hypothetical protein
MNRLQSLAREVFYSSCYILTSQPRLVFWYRSLTLSPMTTTKQTAPKRLPSNHQLPGADRNAFERGGGEKEDRQISVADPASIFFNSFRQRLTGYLFLQSPAGYPYSPKPHHRSKTSHLEDQANEKKKEWSNWNKKLGSYCPREQKAKTLGTYLANRQLRSQAEKKKK